jgi:dCTP deaminase
MTFGKIVFLETYGDPDSYQRTTAKYARTDGIDTSRLHEELRGGAQYGRKMRVNRR